MIEVGDRVVQRNPYSHEVVEAGRVTRVVEMERPLPFGDSRVRRYCEIDGEGLYAEDILEKEEV